MECEPLQGGEHESEASEGRSEPRGERRNKRKGERRGEALRAEQSETTDRKRRSRVSSPQTLEEPAT